VINIGNKQEITIMALAERVRELSGSDSPIKLVAYDDAYESGFEDMPRRVPDLTRVEGLIGYKATLQLDEILTQVIDYFRKK
jgi:UDP-glucose 4-epimerase